MVAGWADPPIARQTAASNSSLHATVQLVALRAGLRCLQLSPVGWARCFGAGGQSAPTYAKSTARGPMLARNWLRAFYGSPITAILLASLVMLQPQI